MMKWLKRFKYSNGFNPIRWVDRGLYRIGHVLSWLPILWRDADWDYQFLYITLRYKLHRMRMHHEKDRVIADWKKVAGQIKVAEQCLDRLIKDAYVDKDFARHVKKYGSFLSNMKMVPSPDGKTMMRETTHSPASSADIRRIGNKEAKLIKKDLETFAKMFVEHSRWWWS